MKRTVESLTPPENKQVMWLDVSGKVKQLKTYINGEWVIVNDDTENNEEIVKEILGKIDKDFESYIKKEDADSKYVQQEVLDRDYVKSEYAAKTYATIKELNNLSTSLDSDYVKKTYADNNYVIKNTLDEYITKSYADNTYATKNTLENYVTITDADTKYVSTKTLDNYVTIETANSTYATQTALASKVAQDTYDTKMTAIDSKLKTLENKTIDVDAELKDSTNPVQNRAVNKAVSDLNTEIDKKADTMALNSAVGRITALENNGATGITVTESGEGNGIASIKNVGKEIVATKATFVTSLVEYATTAAMNAALAKKAEKEHTHSQYALASALDNYALNSALANYVTDTTLTTKLADYATQNWVKQQTFATQGWIREQSFAKTSAIPKKTSQLTNDSGFLTAHQSLAGYVNDVNVTEVTNGNGIASISKDGKSLTVTKGAFLTADSIVAETDDSSTGRGIVDIFIQGNKLRKKVGTFVTPETLGTSIDDYAKDKGYLTKDNLNEKLKETVTIKLVSDKSASDTNLNGATVTVKSGNTTVSTQTWQGTPIKVEVPCDKEVTIEAATVKMYVKPKVLKYVPSPLYNREVTITYKALKTGVFFIDTNDNLIDRDSWDYNKDSVVGVALITEKVAIVIPAGSKYPLKWSTNAQLVEGVTTVTNYVDVIADFNGKANTEAIVKTLGAEAEAAYYCSNYTFKNGRKGHLMSAGEANEMCLNISELSNMLNSIDSSSVNFETGYKYWTSTQQSSSLVWIITDGEKITSNNKTYTDPYTVPIYSLYD